MKPLTHARPQAPALGLTPPTSVTCSEDQSTAVPSVRPKQTAIAASSQATGGIFPDPSPRIVRRGDCGVTLATVPSSTSTSTDPVHNDHRGVTSSRRAPNTTTTRAPSRLPIEKNACSRLITGRRRACSTLTPRVFIETSIAPLPRPKTAAPATSQA